MKEIAMERWERSKDGSGELVVVGQRTAAEVFAELKQRLESIGYLPDERFALDSRWEGGRLIPQGADISCTADYGGSEGVYLDVYLQWSEEGKGTQREHFITGKTLGDSGEDLDRMFLISSAITKAFHGDYAQPARYLLVGGERKGGSLTIGLTPDERSIFIDALIERRERMGVELRGIESLLRRLTGSVTDYIDTVGHRPLNLDGYDRAVLAIHDGEWEAFLELYPKLTERKEELLVEAAGRAGYVGRRMTAHILAELDSVPKEIYTAAIRRAVNTCDTSRVQLLMEQAAGHVSDLDISYYGGLLCHAFHEHKGMVPELVRHSREEWIKNAPPRLLYEAVLTNQTSLSRLLVERGLSPGNMLSHIVRCLVIGRREWELRDLLDAGMKIQSNDYRALDECVVNRSLVMAMLLIEHGMDFDGYCAWAQMQGMIGEHVPIPEELKQYAAALAAQRAGEERREAEHEQAG